MARKAKGTSYRCKAYKHEFIMKPTPNRAILVKCPECGSDDVDFVSA